MAKEYEYLVISAHGSEAEPIEEDDLNEMGGEGWQLVGIQLNNFIFMREKKPEIRHFLLGAKTEGIDEQGKSFEHDILWSLESITYPSCNDLIAIMRKDGEKLLAIHFISEISDEDYQEFRRKKGK